MAKHMMVTLSWIPFIAMKVVNFPSELHSRRKTQLALIELLSLSIAVGSQLSSKTRGPDQMRSTPPDLWSWRESSGRARISTTISIQTTQTTMIGTTWPWKTSASTGICPTSTNASTTTSRWSISKTEHQSLLRLTARSSPCLCQ